MRDLGDKAKKAEKKRAAIGSDIDLAQFFDPAPREYLEDPESLDQETRDRLLISGVDVTQQGRSGTYIQMDGSVVHSCTRQEGVEVISIRDALKKYDWVKEYFWNAVQVDADKYTAQAELKLQDGYFIRSLPGAKTVDPVQACLYIDTDGSAQNVHNIIIAEEGSELHIITGCATSPHLRRGLHVGISEFYIKKGASLTFTMIHNWAEDMFVRPRSASIVGEGGLFLSNYISMTPVKSLQMYPATTLAGEGAVARYYSILVGSPGSVLDVGGRVRLAARNTRAEIVARSISNGGTIINRGHLIGEVEGIKAHLECKGLILNGGIIHAVPELEGRVDNVEMSHEAAVGKIAEEAILYLMSRGLSEDDATSTIVRGFLNVEMEGLPAVLQKEVDRAIKASEETMM